MKRTVQRLMDFDQGHWIETRDGDPDVLAVFDRHYSKRRYTDGREPVLFMGPGEKMVLRTAPGDAIFAWRKFISMDRQEGINCAFFRNESGRIRSSELIRSAMELAWARWPDEKRHYTYVNAAKVQSANPGYCFLMAGWRRCGKTKDRGLHILEHIRTPDGMGANR